MYSENSRDIEDIDTQNGRIDFGSIGFGFLGGQQDTQNYEVAQSEIVGNSELTPRHQNNISNKSNILNNQIDNEDNTEITVQTTNKKIKETNCNETEPYNKRKE